MFSPGLTVHSSLLKLYCLRHKHLQAFLPLQSIRNFNYSLKHFCDIHITAPGKVVVSEGIFDFTFDCCAENNALQHIQTAINRP